MKLVRFLVPRIEYILLAGIFLGIASSGPRLLNFDGDLPRHILTGRLTLQSGEVATTDIFSFRTQGRASIPHEWLSQVVFALVEGWLGLSGIVLLTAVIITATWGIVFSQSLKRAEGLFPALLFTVLGVAASQIHVLPRPHIFTYVMTAIWIAVLDRIDERSPRRWILLPLLMLIWVNLHGMFALGVIIWGVYLIGGLLERGSIEWLRTSRAVALLAGGGLSVATTLLSPSGPGIWRAIVALGSNTYITSRIPEYQSADFQRPETWPFLILLLTILLAFGRSRAGVSWVEVMLVLAFGGIALYSSRMIPLFAIVVTPIAAKSFAAWAREEFPRSRVHVLDQNISGMNRASNGVVWLLILLIFVTLQLRGGKAIDPQGPGNYFSEPFFPVNAAAWLADHPQAGRMVNEFDWGGYLLLQLWPRHQIFMDGHTHIYGEDLTREYERVIGLSPGWESILTKYDVEWAILRADSPLAIALTQTGDWDFAYEDGVAVILTRR